MAGDYDIPEVNPNPFRKPAPEIVTPKKNVTTFSCGQCGAPVSVRYPGHSLSTVCDNCFSVIDTSNEAFNVIQTYYKQMTVHPRIELGARGELMGKTWEVIGFVVRADVASSFKWEEYLLFNPFYGYRWLTCNNGHWSFVTMLKDRPERAASYAILDEKRYKIFYQGKASVFFVLGEFYWRVAVGEEVQMADYILPPYALSVEEDGSQRVWSQSEYVAPKVIKEAFNVDDDSIATPIGVAPNQPSPATDTWNKVGKLWGLFLIALTALQIAHCCLASNRLEYDGTIAYTTKQEGAFDPSGGKAESFTTPEFIVTKDNGNVQISIDSDVDNSWLYIYGELVNSETDEAFTFERTIEYYHGYDDGAWSEGGKSTNFLIDGVPGGKYFVNLDTDNGGTAPASRHTYQFTVRRDVGTFSNYLWCFLFLSLPPMLIWLRSRSIEVARWSDSDYSPYMSSS